MTQEQACRIFGCLADPSRLRIVQALSRGDQYTELLAQVFCLSPSTVSFHLKKLVDAGLVSARKEQYYTVYSLNRTLYDSRISSLAAPEKPQVDQQQKRAAEYPQRVLESFFENGRLKSIPVQRKKKLICYEKIAEAFELGRIYDEKELSAIIAEIHEDYCTIRRDMIAEKLLRREGSSYIRIR